MVRQIEHVLTELGWTDGFHIPVANYENKALESEVEKKLKQKAKFTLQLEELSDRVAALNKHTHNVHLEHQQNQALITAHRSQLDTEEHLYKTAKGEQSRIEQELRQINKTFRELGGRHNALQNEILQHAEKLEKLKTSVKWDKDALMAWEEELARSDENNTLLLRYTAEDESKSKEMELKRQHLRMDVETRRHLLEAIIGEVSTLEQVLERTGQLFRRVHQERQDLIGQWEGSVRVLHQRDQDINRTLEEINTTRAHARERAEEYREQQQFLENEANNNHDMDQQIALTTRKCESQRQSNMKMAQLAEELNNELTVVQRALSSTGSKLEQSRSRSKQLKQDINKKNMRITDFQSNITTARERLNLVMNRWLSATERIKQLEEMLQGEERLMNILNQDVARMLQMLFRAQQQEFKLRQNGESQEVDLKNIEVAKAALLHHAQHLDKELQRQKEMMYTLDFEAQKVESRIAHVTGDRSLEEHEINEKTIRELEETLAQKTTTFNMLTSQVQHLEDKMRHLTADLVGDEADLARLKDRRQDQVLLTDGGRKQLEKSRRCNQERQVEENVLRLRTKQAEAAIQKEGGFLYTLEKQKLELEAAMKERQVEIGLHSDLLQAKKRALNEEKSRLNCEIQEQKIRVSQMKKKFDIAVMALGTDENGEQLSITHFKIKSAQEKYMLQEQGDELDAKIRKAEKEILAMENTLKVVNLTNDTYKKNLATVDKDSPEYQQKKELESQYYVVIDKLRHRRSQFNELTADVEVMEQTVEELSRTEDEIRATWREKDQEAADLDRDLRDQQTKLQRAEKQLRKLIRELKGTSQTKLFTAEEKDIDIRELQEQNQSALQQLAELVARRIETGPVVGRYLYEKGLTFPIIRYPLGSKTRLRLLGIPDQDSPTASSAKLSQTSVSRESSSPSVVTLDAGQLDDASATSSNRSNDTGKRRLRKKK